jgi:Protein of unknown function (DUF1631)
MHAPQLIRSGIANDTGKLRPTLQHTLEAALSISDSMIDELLLALAPACDLSRQGGLPLGLELVDVVTVERLVADADALKRDWHQRLRQVLYHGQEVHAGGQHASMRFDDLRLLDDRQISDSIEFATAEQALLTPTADVLPRLNALVCNLMGWLTIQADLNPLRPRSYALALRALMEQHVPDEQQRSVLFVPVTHIMGESLRQVYRELVQWLQAHGVEPLQPPSARLTPDQPPSQAVGRTLLTLSRLRQLLAGDLNSDGDGAPMFMHTVPASMTALEDMDLIEPLIRRLRQRPAPGNDAQEQALPELPVVSGQHLGRLLGQEVVRLMLEHITHDERLLPAIRRQIGALEPSLIRLSLVDPRFFSDRQHPARQLLEVIAQRSLAFQSHRDDGFDELLGSVTAAVHSLERVQVSEEVFARLLKRLRQRWEQDDARKQHRQAEAARALLHAEQRQMLAERVAADFRQRWQGKEVPEFVQRFLMGPWAQAVAETQLMPAPAVGAEEKLDDVADELIWSVQPALIRRDADRLTRLVPRLTAQLRHGLERIGFPEDLVNRFLDELVGLHQKAFDVPTLNPLPVVHEVASGPVHLSLPVDAAADPPDLVEDEYEASTDTPMETFWIAGQAAEEAGFVADVSGPMPLEPLAPFDLTTGAWVDLRVKGEWIRAQLTWTSPRGGLYMFLSSRGLAHSMTRRTMDRLMGNDALRIVSRSGVVDSALDAVAQQALRNTQDGV